MKKSVWCVLAAATLALAATPALSEDKSDLAGRCKSWAERFDAGDDAGIAALYSDDALRMPYQAPPVKASEIVANIGAARQAGATSIDLKVVEAESQGNLAWGRGTYVLKNADGSVFQRGKWLNVSIKAGGTWKIHRDIWNTDAPEE